MHQRENGSLQGPRETPRCDSPGNLRKPQAVVGRRAEERAHGQRPAPARRCQGIWHGEELQGSGLRKADTLRHHGAEQPVLAAVVCVVCCSRLGLLR